MPEKIEKQYTGGCIDYSISEDATKLIRKISNSPELLEKFQEIIGEYRFDKTARDTIPSKSAQIQHLDDLKRDISELMKNINLLPEDVKSLASDILLKLDRGVYEHLEENLITQLAQYNAFLGYASEQISSWPDWVMPNKKLEKNLLCEVFLLLRPYIKKPGETVEKAKEVLEACLYIQFPESRESLLKIIPKEIKNLPIEIPK